MVSAELKIEDKLWAAADKLRGSMDASEYKNVVLGLIFLKYVSDSFEEKYEELTKDEYADPEDKDEYLADNIFGYRLKQDGKKSIVMLKHQKLVKRLMKR